MKFKAFKVCFAKSFDKTSCILNQNYIYMSLPRERVTHYSCLEVHLGPGVVLSLKGSRVFSVQIGRAFSLWL